mgnify:FL=1
MTQKFYAAPSTRTEEANGAISYAPGGMMDCLGHFAKISNCPIAGTDLRLTCYATNYADTYFSIPAVTRYKGKRIVGYFTGTDTGPEFRVLDSHKHLLG